MRRLFRLWHGLSDSLRDAALYGASLAWTKALAMLTLPLLTAMLAPADFARLELLSSAAEIGALFAGAGLVDTAYRFAGTNDTAGRRAAAEVLGLGMMIALAGTALAVAFASRFAALIPLPTGAPDMALLGTAVALESVIAVPLAWMRMRGKAGRYAAATALRSTLQAGLVAACVMAGWGVTGVLAGGAIAAVAAAVLLTVRQARKSGLIVAPRGWGRFLAYGLPLVGSGLASFMLGTADRWLLAGTVAAAELGQYGLAAKIAMIAALLTQPFELWWYPQRIRMLSTPDGVARSARIVTTGIALTVLSAGATAVAGPLLIRVLTPVAYHPAAVFVPWLAAGLALQSLGSLVNVGCYVGRTGNVPMVVNGVAGGVAVAAYLLLIPHYGVSGAIAATLVAQATRFALFLHLSQRRVRLPLHGRDLIVPVVASIAAGAMPQICAQSALGFGLAIMALCGAVASMIISGTLPTPFATQPIGAPARA